MGDVTPIFQGLNTDQPAELRRLRLADELRHQHAGGAAPGQRVFVVLFLDTRERVVSKITISATTANEALKARSGRFGRFEVYHWEQFSGREYVVKGKGVLPPPGLN